MKTITTAARILLGSIFVLFGLNGFFVFIEPPEHTETSGAFIDLLISTKFLYVEKTLEVIGGALLLVNRYVPLGLTILGPLVANILLFHLLMERRTIAAALAPLVLWSFLMLVHRRYFAALFTKRAEI